MIKHLLFLAASAISITVVLMLTATPNMAIAAPPCGTPKGGPCGEQAPTADIVGPNTAVINTVFLLSGSDSSDPEGGALSYIWSYIWSDPDNPNPVAISTQSAVQTDVSISALGTFSIQLQVTDEQGLADSTTITIEITDGETDQVTLRPDCGLDDEVATLEQRVDDCLGKMTWDEKIGQMTMSDHLELKGDDHVTTFMLGALLAGGGHAPATGNEAIDWARMVDKYQRDALSTRLGIPLLFGVDAVHGHSNVSNTTIFPHNIGLGATRNPALACEVGRITASEVAGTGINWNFSPCLCVSRDERWGRSYESFGEHPDIASMMTSLVGGYQGTGTCPREGGLGAVNSVLATAKHWLGDGGTQGGIDQGDTSSVDLLTIHTPPFFSAIDDEDVGSVMISYSSVDGIPMHANPDNLIDTKLKGTSENELGFDGIVLSDWAGITKVSRRGFYATAVEGGIDMAMEPYNYDSFIRELNAGVEANNQVLISRIDDAVTRILTTKFKLGLFDAPYGRLFSESGDPVPEYSSLRGTIRSAAHRDVARQAVRESLVLLKNQGGVLPLAKNLSTVLVAGKSANDIGNQSGGWTISWQGDSGNITDGDTVYEGIRAVVDDETIVSLQVSPQSGSNADIGIVVVGETPYAEGAGDDSTLTLSRKDKDAVNKVCNSINCVVVLISGRPLIITDLIENPSVQAVVAAWLPGTEGRGIAELLFGDFNFSGTLPVSWPASMSQIPINYDDPGYYTDGSPNAPLFRLGYGLTY